MNTSHSNNLIMTGPIDNPMNTVDFHELLVRILYTIYLSAGLLGLSGLWLIVRNVTSWLHFSLFDNVVVALTAVSLINCYGKVGYFLAGIFLVIKVLWRYSKISQPVGDYSGIVSCDIQGRFPIEIEICETDTTIGSHPVGCRKESSTDCSTNFVLNESNECDRQDGSALSDCRHLDCNAEEKIRLSSNMYDNDSDECAKNEASMENSKKDLHSSEQKTLTQNSTTKHLISESCTMHQQCPISPISFPLKENSNGFFSSCAEVATNEILRADEFLPVPKESDSGSKVSSNLDSDSTTNTAFLRGKEKVQLLLRTFLKYGAFVPSTASGIKKMFSAPSNHITFHNRDEAEYCDVSKSSCEGKRWTTDATSTSMKEKSKASCSEQSETSKDSLTDDCIGTEELQQESAFHGKQTSICRESRNKDAQDLIASSLPNKMDDIVGFKEMSRQRSNLLYIPQRIKEQEQIMNGMIDFYQTVTAKPIVDISSNLNRLSTSYLCTKAAPVTQDLIEIVDEERENMIVDLVGLSEVICINDEDDEYDIRTTITPPKKLLDADKKLGKRGCSISSIVQRAEKMVSEDDFSLLDFESNIEWDLAFSPDNEYEREKKRARKHN